MKQMLLMSPVIHVVILVFQLTPVLIQEFGERSSSDVTVGCIAFREALSAAHSNSGFSSAKAALLLSEKVVARSSFCGSAFCCGWQMETADKFFCSAVKWSEDEFHRWSEIASPCCHLIRSEFCCLSGEFAEKASLQKFCNLKFECFLWKFNRNSAESRNLWFAESAKQFWFSRMLLDQRNFCVRQLWPASSSTGV